MRNHCHTQQMWHYEHSNMTMGQQSQPTGKGHKSQDTVPQKKRSHTHTVLAIPTHSATSNYVMLMFQKKKVTAIQQHAHMD